jgi:transcriptional regulator with XRE-family HTH domain
MDYNAIASDIIHELKNHARRSDSEIASRLGISRQAYVNRRNKNSLTTEDITILSAWLVTSFGGGFYIDKYFKD